MPVFILGSGEGSCLPPRYELLAGLLLRPGLSAWLQTPARTKMLKSFTVPSTFRAPSGLFYAVLTKGPATLVIRNEHGEDVYSASVLQPLPADNCDGLDPATSGFAGS
jgi:hypothetical protein